MIESLKKSTKNIQLINQSNNFGGQGKTQSNDVMRREMERGTDRKNGGGGTMWLGRGTPPLPCLPSYTHLCIHPSIHSSIRLTGGGGGGTRRGVPGDELDGWGGGRGGGGVSINKYIHSFIYFIYQGEMGRGITNEWHLWQTFCRLRKMTYIDDDGWMMIWWENGK